MKYISIALFAFLVFSCKKEVSTKSLSASAIINKSIEVSGGESFESSMIKFIFRDRSYVAKRLNGQTSMVRMFIDKSDTITDFLSNSEYKRLVGQDYVKVADSMVKKYTASVNSVHYFSVLPYGLNDEAVNKTVLEEENIKSKDYYKIKVTFNEDSGGEDYEDVFLYWIDKKSFKVDYVAYSYSETEGNGMRFRAAYNERYVNGIRFVDYNNYKAEDGSIQLLDLGKAFENNELELLSKIELENVNVDLIDN
jgi:hypothetical protein